MKTRMSLSNIIVLALLLAAVVTTVLSAFILNLLDQVVFGDLSNYGLQFNYEWAWQYWSYSGLMMSSLTVAFVVGVTLIVYILVYARTREISSTRFVSYPLLLVGILNSFFSLFFFNHIDIFVQNDLYNYGLHFSIEWSEKYWTQAKSMLSLLEVTIAVSLVAIVLISKGAKSVLPLEPPRMISFAKTPAPTSPSPTSTEHIPTSPSKEMLAAEAELEMLRRKVWSYRRLPTRLAGYAMTFVGAAVLAGSMVFSSTVWAIVGLVLTFWGVFFFFLKPTSLVKADLLDSASFSFLQNVHKLISEFGLKGKGVYLPPRSLKELRSGLVYISAREEVYVPTLAEVGEAGEKIFLKNPDGVCLVPSGVALANLFERELGTSFAGVGLEYLLRNLPKVFVEDLEIAEDFELSVENGTIHVRIEGLIYKDLCHELRRLSGVCQVFGCPLCSSIAIALARASGKPVVIDENEPAQDGKATDVYYRVLEQ